MHKYKEYTSESRGNDIIVNVSLYDAFTVAEYVSAESTETEM